MTIDRDVFLSLLSLDSYNRGYGANVNGVSETGPVGNASAISRSAIFGPNTDAQYQNWQNAGFYSIAYEWNGETIISYRGTNFDIQFDTVAGALDSPLIKDVWNGWTVGAGFAEASQAGLAIDFYEAVTNKSVYEFNNDPVTLTGHSLGGGLAGFVAGLSYSSAIGYDHMPYGQALIAQAIHEANRLAAIELGLGHYNLDENLGEVLNQIEDETLPEIQDGTITRDQFAQAVGDNYSALAPNPEALIGYYAENEILEEVRNGNTQIIGASILSGVLTALGLPNLGNLIGGYVTQLGLNTGELEANVAKHEISIRGSDLGGLVEQPVAAHSIALLTILLFGERQWSSEGGGSQWEDSVRYILPSISNDSLSVIR